jgi:hypothetical protein
MNIPTLIKISDVIYNDKCTKRNECYSRCCEKANYCIPKSCCDLIRSTDKDIQRRITSNIISYLKNNKSFDLFIELFSNEELLNNIYSNDDVE